jgi:GMP synthase-like glutamine amidotransferase
MNSTSTQSAAIKSLGILQAGRTPEQMSNSHQDYNRLFVELLGEQSFDYRHWAVLDGHFPDSVNDADAWLITGSRFGAYEDHDWIPPLEQFVRDVFAAEIPMVGICFGHQVIAQALGGKVEKFSGGWSVGRVEYDLDSTVFGNDLAPNANAPIPGSEFSLMAFHQDQVIEPPDSAQTVGSTSFCKHAALAYDNRILTLQPHPEFDKHFVEGLLEARGDILPKGIKQSAEHSLHLPLMREPIADTLRRFLTRESI